MPAYRCRSCGAGAYSEARLRDLTDGGRCGECGGRLSEVGRLSPEDRQVGNVLYPAALRDVQASPVDPPIAGGKR